MSDAKEDTSAAAIKELAHEDDEWAEIEDKFNTSLNNQVLTLAMLASAAPSVSSISYFRFPVTIKSARTKEAEATDIQIDQNRAHHQPGAGAPL